MLTDEELAAWSKGCGMQHRGAAEMERFILTMADGDSADPHSIKPLAFLRISYAVQIIVEE
jgi:hypothetical protein